MGWLLQYLFRAFQIPIQGRKTSWLEWITVNEVSPYKSNPPDIIRKNIPLEIANKRECMKNWIAADRCSTEERKILTFRCCLEVLVKKCHWWKGMLNSVIPKNFLATWNKTKTNIKLTVHTWNDRQINNWHDHSLLYINDNINHEQKMLTRKICQ